MLPEFTMQPDEVNEFQPGVVSALRDANLVVFLEKTCDLLIVRPQKSPLNLELKVRLASQRQKIPITSFQWNLFREVGVNSNFNNESRVLIHNGESNLYALTKISELVPGLTNAAPNSTSYVTRAHLDSLAWAPPAEAWNLLLEWVHSA